MAFFFLWTMASPQFIQSSRSMYSSLSYSSRSGQPECLLGTTSKWCCFTCTHDSSLLISNISRPQRLYPSSRDQPSTGRLSPLPNFFNHAPHMANVHTHELATQPYRLRAPS